MSIQLSVVVNMLLGGSYTRRCISLLHTQQDVPTLEIIVPVWPGFDDVASLIRTFPNVRFPVVTLPEDQSNPADPGFASAVYERRRAVGLAAAQGEIVALTEDQVIPDPRWCASLLKAHSEWDYGAIGGAVENAGRGVLHRALYLCDFGRYGRPFRTREALSLTDQNVSYKSAALRKVEPVWREMYHEPAVHEALRMSGEGLLLTPEPVVHLDRGRLSWFAQLRERYLWGRVFGGKRARRVPASRRWLLLAGSPTVPILILLRVLARHPCGHTFAAVPAVAALAIAWAIGEAVGYGTGRAFG